MLSVMSKANILSTIKSTIEILPPTGISHDLYTKLANKESHKSITTIKGSPKGEGSLPKQDAREGDRKECVALESNRTRAS